MLAHDLRNPPAPVANALHLLRSVNPLAERALDIADRPVKLLSRLVDDMMEVSRITRGKIVLPKETVDLDRPVSR